MIKYFFLLLFTCLIYLCSCSKRAIVYAEIINDNASDCIEDIPDSTAFEVMEIKKENSWYFIYFQRNDSIFKVVSHDPRYKTLLENYPKIERGKRYKLNLHSFRDELNRALGGTYIGDPLGVQLDSITTVSPEPDKGVWDIYKTTDLVGLYYLKQR